MSWTDCLSRIEAKNAHLHPQLPASEFHNSLLISPRHHYVFANNPKVACTTIRKLLIDAEFGKVRPYQERAATLHYKEFLPFHTVWQLGDFPAYLNRPDVFCFCFVRNPYTRLLSGYLDKVVGSKPQKNNILKQLGNEQDTDREIDFPTFVRAVCAMPPSQQDAHWRVQYYQTAQTGIPFDFVGRFERLEHDLREVADRLGVSGFIDEHLFGRATTTSRHHATGADQRIRDFYTPELRDLVAEAFRIDFQHFGYSYDLPN